MTLPETNAHVAVVVYETEVALRELIREDLYTLAGPNWWKTRLPPDAVPKIKEARRYERATPWSGHIPHHPIHYLDLGDLRKTIASKANWDECFSQIFKRKDLFETNLSQLEPVRNAFAHSRKVSDRGLGLAVGVRDFVKGLLGSRWYSLVQATSEGASIPEHLRQVRDQFMEWEDQVQRSEPATPWSLETDAWWMDEDYLSAPLDAVHGALTLMREYQELPRGRGLGPSIQRWTRTNALPQALQLAVQQIDTILEGDNDI